jgi:amidase
MTNLTFAAAVDIAAAIKAGDISSREITEHYIQRIERLDSTINAMCVRVFDQALAAADRADAALAQGQSLGPLHGVPMSIKESYVLEGTPATWGIPAYRNNMATADGLAVARFKAAGAHFLGKTNVPIDLGDFQSYNEIYGTTNNPWDTSRTPGGSSGGSAAALAAGFTALEAGSDIGGSIRTPAHFCGVFGHKPTWGIVPMQGHELMSGVPDPDLSVCGPLARDPRDLRLALEIMAKPAGRQAVGWQLSLPDCSLRNLQGLNVAVWASDEMAPVSEETKSRVLQVAAHLEALGANVDYQARPNFDVRKAHMTYESLLTAVMSSAKPESVVEAAKAKAQALDASDQSRDAVATRATVMMHRDWIRHNFRREKLREAWDEFFTRWDVLLCPQFTVPAIPHDHRPFEEREIDVDGELRPYFEPLFWAGLIVASHLPSTVFPTGMGEGSLPIGLQLVSGPYQDYKTIEVSRLVAEALGGFEAPLAFR